MKTSLWTLFAIVLVLSSSRIARAAPLLDIRGQLTLADGALPTGATAKLQVDLDRNGKFDKFETLSAKVGDDGNYSLAYELDPTKVDLEFVTFVAKIVADFKVRGLDALISDGPLPIFVSFERTGYATVTRRLSSLLTNASLDVVLAPLAEINCSDGTCMTPGGTVRLQGFGPGTGITRAFAQAFDPSLDTDQFPGTFSDREDNLLISSGFAEINVFDKQGKPITSMTSPVSARFELQRASWATVPDLTPDSGIVELPMYSFDRVSGEWIREGNGELQLEDGTPVPENVLSAIREGSFEQSVFVSFMTKHFSTFNCDEPRKARACVKGRLIDDQGGAMQGVTVTLDGQSYTGNAGSMVTGADGYFAGDVMRSEQADQDLDNNGHKGDVFRARVRVTGSLGVFTGAAFDTPSVESSVNAKPGSRTSCKPQQCDCTDLGDVVAVFERPRLCEARFRVTFGGSELTSDDGPLASGDALQGAQVHAQLVGGLNASQASLRALCADRDCGFGTTDADGRVTLTVPVIGDEPQLQVSADLDIMQAESSDHYSGRLTIEGCGVGSATLEVETQLETSHTSLRGLGAFIAALGAKPTRTAADGGTARPASPLRCGGCRTLGARRNTSAPVLVGLCALAVFTHVRASRRRRRGAKR